MGGRGEGGGFRNPTLELRGKVGLCDSIQERRLSFDRQVLPLIVQFFCVLARSACRVRFTSSDGRDDHGARVPEPSIRPCYYYASGSSFKRVASQLPCHVQ